MPIGLHTQPAHAHFGVLVHDTFRHFGNVNIKEIMIKKISLAGINPNAQISLIDAYESVDSVGQQQMMSSMFPAGQVESQIDGVRYEVIASYVPTMPDSQQERERLLNEEVLPKEHEIQGFLHGVGQEQLQVDFFEKGSGQYTATVVLPTQGGSETKVALAENCKKGEKIKQKLIKQKLIKDATDMQAQVVESNIKLLAPVMNYLGNAFNQSTQAKEPITEGLLHFITKTNDTLVAKPTTELLELAGQSEWLSSLTGDYVHRILLASFSTLLELSGREVEGATKITQKLFPGPYKGMMSDD